MEIIEKFDKFKKYTFEDLIEIKKPINFYTKIKNSMVTANNVIIFSMYFGDGEMCKELLNIIIERERKGMKTKIVLDKNQRTSKKLMIFANEKNLKCFQFLDLSTCIDFLRLKEISAQFHSKLYMFDDEIILTGANLEDYYFKNRLDRYFIIKNRALGEDLQNLKTSSRIIQNIRNNCLIKYGRQDEKYVLEVLFNTDFDSVVLSSAYFNLPSAYCDILKKQKNVNFFVSAPKYNIFNNFGKFGPFISKLYEFISYRTLQKIPKATLYQFGLEGYTLHKKGIWAFKDDICVSILGSSNFNRRSSERDEELNFCVITQDPKIYKIFNVEVSFLKINSKSVQISNFNFGKYKILYLILFLLFGRFL
ncbi:CDP-diacylglycerol--glycerol-3-phosphate 3-phosphatidyltransferase [Vairimorpha necatrix]|uniref:CDP-diacylglycerol--glycerol-3-phosphate 3-phosphatidyltransferase n=1 Tax=Vairimorpha necatrix TaxID=6039 RepID=A0AAX4J8H5_9MICR